MYLFNPTDIIIHSTYITYVYASLFFLVKIVRLKNHINNFCCTIQFSCTVPCSSWLFPNYYWSKLRQFWEIICSGYILCLQKHLKLKIKPSMLLDPINIRSYCCIDARKRRYRARFNAPAHNSDLYAIHKQWTTWIS